LLEVLFLSEHHCTVLGAVIDYGGFSEVRLTRDHETGKLIAVKHIYPENYDREQFTQEVDTLMRLDHPCICRIVRWAFPSGANEAEIHMEYAENRSLASVLQRAGWREPLEFWNPTGKAMIICGIVLGMRFVHSQGYIHRDLKPRNILINNLGRALVTDFGAARPESPDATMTAETGSVYYAAPELFHEDIPCTDKADLFSFGSIAYEILTGRAAFPSSTPPLAIIPPLLAGKMPEIPESCGDLMKAIIRECWNQQPEFRPSFHAIIERFQNSRFEILPGVEAVRVSGYVRGVNRWERGNSS
jgi:serine/threonine-protein kinase